MIMKGSVSGMFKYYVERLDNGGRIMDIAVLHDYQEAVEFCIENVYDRVIPEYDAPEDIFYYTKQLI